MHGEEEGGGGRGRGGCGQGRELHITHTWVAWRGDVVMGLVSWETMMVVVVAATAGSLACINWQAAMLVVGACAVCRGGGRVGEDCHAAQYCSLVRAFLSGQGRASCGSRLRSKIGVCGTAGSGRLTSTSVNTRWEARCSRIAAAVHAEGKKPPYQRAAGCGCASAR